MRKGTGQSGNVKEEGGWGGCSLCQQWPCLLTPDFAFWDHTDQNLIRIGLACIVLMSLVWLLVEDWLSRKRDKEGTNRSPSWEYKRRWRVHCSLEEEQRNAISMRELKAAPGPRAIWALYCPLEEGRHHCRNEGVVSPSLAKHPKRAWGDEMSKFLL